MGIILTIRHRLGRTSRFDEARREIEEVEEVLEAQKETSQSHLKRIKARRKKAEAARDAAEQRLRKSTSRSERSELEDRIERMDTRVGELSKRVKGLDRRISMASDALVDLDFIRMDIDLADDLDDVDYLETIEGIRTKLSAEAHGEAMPGETFETVCDEIGSVAEQTAVDQHGAVVPDDSWGEGGVSETTDEGETEEPPSEGYSE